MFKVRVFVMLLLTIACAHSSGFARKITLDSVDGLWNSSMDSIMACVPITFYLRVTGDSDNHGSIMNGFRVYSDDSVRWGSFSADTLPSGWHRLFDLIFHINTCSADGSGADTVGFGGSKTFGSGLPAGFNEVAYTISIGPIDAVYHGRTVCLDSSFYPPSGLWLWRGPEVIPGWDGPHCFTVFDVCEAMEPDRDGDSVNDFCDNCPDVFNLPQTDADADSVGDVCDNCPDVYNPTQADTNGNGIGDACDSAQTGFSDIAITQDLPRDFALAQNYPNPFNPSTAIEFSIPVRTRVEISIYNQLGQRIAMLMDDVRPAGVYRVFWDGKNDSGHPLASGVYIYTLRAGDIVQSKKMLLLK